jgi:hypothetical protein
VVVCIQARPFSFTCLLSGMYISLAFAQAGRNLTISLLKVMMIGSYTTVEEMSLKSLPIC